MTLVAKKRYNFQNIQNIYSEIHLVCFFASSHFSLLRWVLSLRKRNDRKFFLNVKYHMPELTL